MSKLEILQKAIDSQEVEIKKFRTFSWSQRRDYYLNNDRIENLYALFYFLSLREKIKKEVQNNYLDLSKIQIVTYCEYGLIEFERQLIYKGKLQPLIDNYIKQQINLIENNTLKLEL